ncbi:type II secretion system F family protein [Acidithiobacillus ferridurans]|nr:type II secretion system F family protein [Acidithiobacillus ferridurans]MBU2715028.1 hypothetical protein [Acidithiobacillus ferridurans]MBU2725420.1 hypothetical protein [Acidithiobacillus ferridurans]
MKKIYRYVAKGGGTAIDEGMVVAQDKNAAIQQLRDRGLRALSIDFSLNETIAYLTSSKFSADGLASYYMGIGLRIKNGMEPERAVSDMKSQPRHFRLRMAAQDLSNLMRTGMKMGQAMGVAGFPERDCAIISALEQGAKAANGFENMSLDYQRNAEISRKVRGMLIEPTFIGIAGVIGIWFTIVYGVPIYQHAFAQLTSNSSSKIPGYARAFYGFADQFDKDIPLNSVLYFASVAGFVLFLRSVYFKRILDTVGTLRRFSEMVDNASLWGGFRLLIETSIDQDSIPFMLAKSAARSDSRKAFEALGARVRQGTRYPVAIRESGFPDYIAGDAASAMSAPGINAQVQALDMMRNILAMRVSEMAEKVVVISRILTLIAAGALILGIAMLTFMPILMTELTMV